MDAIQRGCPNTHAYMLNASDLMEPLDADCENRPLAGGLEAVELIFQASVVTRQ